MKRFICIILIALTCFSLFADNLQKKYLTSDDIWIRANRLCISTGHLGPAPVSPTTGAEIKQALERLDYSSLTLQQKAEYDAIMDELINSSVELAFESRYITLDPEVTVSLEGYAFNNLKNTGVDEFFIPYRDRRPFLYAGVDALFGDFMNLISTTSQMSASFSVQPWTVQSSISATDIIYTALSPISLLRQEDLSEMNSSISI